jgi:hypothetical protein
LIPNEKRREVTDMRYTRPELVVLGPAPALVMGALQPGYGDNDISVTSFPPAGISLGLDD